MSIRSIDMQVLIPKATEVGKQQNSLAQQSTVQQQQFAEQMQKTAEMRQHQVQGLTKSQGGKVERDEQKDKSNSQRQDNPEENNKAAATELLEQENTENSVGRDPILGHIIDIKT